MKKLNLTIDGKDLEVFAQKLKGKIWFHHEGETFSYEPKSSTTQNTGAAAQDPTQIVAPMPGKIIKVFTSVGAEVKEGETLVAMEAMKMEYNLKATQDMKVTQVNCNEQQQVALGEVLIKMEEV